MSNKAECGVLTFQNTVNYGAMLQTYALQKYINSVGINCEVINYVNKSVENVERPIKLLKQRTIKGVIKYFKCHNFQKRKWQRFSEFKRNNIKMSNETYYSSSIAEIGDKYRYIIVGSDQVWNPELTDNDYTYYLDFLSNRDMKKSYAASFGFAEWPNKNKEKAMKLLEEFSSLNVREEQAKSLVMDGTGRKDVKVVVDPTFLLNKNEWEQFVDKNEKEYIVVYMIDFREDVFDFIRKLAKENNCEIIYFHDAIRSQKNMINSRDDSVERFLSVINNAKYVVTGSFHALCMSLIFEKQFYYTLNSKNNRNSRVSNLMNLVNQEHRIVENGVCHCKEFIDYNEVKVKLSEIIEESKKILRADLER